jgi:hypothetical protein
MLRLANMIGIVENLLKAGMTHKRCRRRKPRRTSHKTSAAPKDRTMKKTTMVRLYLVDVEQEGKLPAIIYKRLAL